MIFKELQSQRTKNIITGTALTLLLCTVPLFIPILGVFSLMFIPLPIIYYHIKFGRKEGLIISLISIGIMTFFLGTISIDVVLFTELIFLGFIICELLKKGFAIDKTILYACLIIFLIEFVLLLAYSNITSINLLSLATNYIKETLDKTIAFYKSIGQQEDNILMISKHMNEIAYTFTRIIPSIAISLTLFVAWVNIILARLIFYKKKIYFPDFGPLNLWKAPDNLIWGVIFSIALIFIPYSPFKIIGYNCIIVLMTIYFFQGIAIVSFFFEKKKIPIALKVLIYFLIAIQQFLLIVVIGLGLFDMWINFRKLGSIKDLKA